VLVNEGVQWSTLQQQVAEPASHVDVQLQMISADTGIPKRILSGSERGELASSEDRDNWNDLITGRREEFAEPSILTPLVEKGIQYGFFPPPQQEEAYRFQWMDLFAPSEKEKADVGNVRAQALKAYASSPMAADFIPPQIFAKHFLGMDEGQVEEVMAEMDQQTFDEQREEQEDGNMTGDGVPPNDGENGQ
jgi:hypothetical protein